MSHCRVHLLDESKIDIGVDLHAHGKQLLESVCKYLNVVEVDYFGLKYKGEDYDGVWVRLDKGIKKQFPLHTQSWQFTFAVKYYPTDSTYLKEETTKYQLCLQIRENLVSGKLHCSLDSLITLSSYWLQSEFGDGKEATDEVKEYLGSLKNRLGEKRSDPDFEEKVERAYKSKQGMPPADADAQFLRLATNLPFYGLHLYNVRNEKAEDMVIGIGAAGVHRLEGEKLKEKYKWNSIKNINYRKEKFFLKLLASNAKGHSTKKTYHLRSYLSAKAIWRNAVDQHVFFRASNFDKRSTTPSTRKRKDIRRRKSKLNLSFSFRKKKPKTEVEVREESLRIKRPNPSVVRHPSLQRTASLKSSLESRSHTKQAGDEETIPKKIMTSSKPILKSPETVAEARGPQQTDVEARKQSLRIKNLTNDQTIIKEPLPRDGSLLLTTAIVEEEEDISSEGKSPSSSKPASSYAGSSLDPHSPSKASVPTTPEVIVTSFNEEEETPPYVAVDAPEDSRRLSVEVYDEPNHSKFLPPPLLPQSTRDAILPYINAELQHEAEGFPTPPEITIENEREDEKVEIIPFINKEIDLGDSKPSDTSTNSQSSVETPVDERKTDYVEDDRRTIGAISHVAVHGDDDATIKDFVDDVIMFEATDSYKESCEDNESRITESSDSSISNLTDNTEELCNPNILEIIWSKCKAGRECGYREIFGVKLRKVPGRSREVGSSLFDLTQQESVGTQVPTPPLPSDSKNNKEKESRGAFLFSNGRKYIPSWPFDPDSLANKVELDEIDKEAIKAALKAQSEVKNEIDFDGTSVMETLLENEITDIKPELEMKSDARVKFENTQKDSIPGIPDFCSSVGKNENDSNKSDQTLPSVETPGTSEMQSNASNCLRKSFAPELLVEKSVSIPLLTNKEPLIFPPNIHTFPNTEKNSDLLVYEPITHSLPIDKESELTLVVETDSAAISQQLNAKLHNTIEEVPEVIQDETKKLNFLYMQQQSRDIVESGRSTPSSVSSFPQFVHSVYPLRKMSTSWGSVSTEDQVDAKIGATLENSETSSTLSDFSNRSVKGSSNDSSTGPLEEMNFPRFGSVSEIQSTQNTTNESLNEVRAETGNNEDSSSIGEYKTYPSSSSSSKILEDAFEYTDDFSEETASTTPSSSTIETEKSVGESSESLDPLESLDHESSMPSSSELSIDLSTVSLPSNEPKQKLVVEEFNSPKEDKPGSSRSHQDTHESCTLRYQPAAPSNSSSPVKMYDEDDDSFSSDSEESNEYAFSNPSEGANTQRSVKSVDDDDDDDDE